MVFASRVALGEAPVAQRASTHRCVRDGGCRGPEDTGHVSARCMIEGGMIHQAVRLWSSSALRRTFWTTCIGVSTSKV
jgi:hypothetical protein